MHFQWNTFYQHFYFVCVKKKNTERYDRYGNQLLFFNFEKFKRETTSYRHQQFLWNKLLDKILFFPYFTVHFSVAYSLDMCVVKLSNSSV